LLEKMRSAQRVEEPVVPVSDLKLCACNECALRAELREALVLVEQMKAIIAKLEAL